MHLFICRRFHALLFFACLGDWCGLPVSAAVNLAPLFRDNMVLQCEKPVPIWGEAEAGEKVTVFFQEQRVSTTADASGRWLLRLDPMPACAGPAQMRVHGTNTIELNRILVGSAARVTRPAAVRYAWRNDPPCPLYNAAGLPASPFRSDNWE